VAMKVKELFCIIHLLTFADDKMRKALLRSCNDDMIKLIGETALNLLHEVIPLSPHFKSKLLDHAQVIRAIGSKRVKGPRRRQLCIRHSNIVGLLLKAASSELEDRFGGK